jgi:LCP family protein required for cell wall assembly
MTHRSDPDDASGKQPSAGNDPAASGLGKPANSGRKRLTTGQRVAAWLSVAVVAILVIAVVGVYFVYRSDYQNIKRIDIQNIVGKQPPKLNNAENILLIGSDTRTGQGGIGGAADTGCNCSDTLMVLHISPGHKGAVVMSIPRDSMVPVEECDPSDGTPGQQAAPGEYERINSTLAYGGPACTFKVVEDQTGIHLDHFGELDFTGFINVVNDLGGVNVCLPFGVDDSMSGLNLSAGMQHINGTQALAFWRTREDLGEGSDLQRIQRDQYLMAALVQGMLHSGLLHSPTKMFSVVRDATNAMTTDSGLDENAMLQVADSMQGLSAKNVQFVTVPNIPYPEDPDAELSWEQPQANQLFSAVQDDVKLPSASPSPSSSAAAPQLDVAPSQVNVDVENGSGIAGIASQTASDLSGAGFNVVGTGDASSFGYTNSVIEYAGSSDMPAVDTLKAQIPGAQTQQDSSLTPGTLQLIVGSSFSGLSSSPSSSPSPSPSSSSSPSVTSVASSDGAVSANVGLCTDQGAFTGPDSP